MIRTTSLVCAFALALSGCCGRAPNLVVAYQPGDEDRSCEALRAEIAENETEIVKLLPGEDATGKNVALGVTGAFLVVPLLFMDFKDGECIEIDALRRRNLWLREAAHNKGCSLPAPALVFEEEEVATTD